MHESDESGDDAQIEMPRYVSHKKVWALEIASIGEPLNGHRSLAFRDKGYAGKSVREELFSRYVPVPGDFYVVYVDGYQSFSPRIAFLEGYKAA